LSVDDGSGIGAAVEDGLELQLGENRRRSSRRTRGRRHVPHPTAKRDRP
jgi:hypothetical protein